MTVDPRAATGFGRDAEAYERGRPTYAPAAIDHLAREFGLSAASTVLDLAAGTGKLTRSLIPRAGRVIAVEPSPAMRAELRRQVPAADILEGSAEAIPLEDASLDAVFVGQAFHWFRAAEALEEIARVLRPGGGLALLWNHARWKMRWLERFKALVDPPRAAAGEFPSDDWKEALERDNRFGPRSDAEFPHVHRVGIDDFLALVGSWSWIANLERAERSTLLDEVRVLTGEQPVLELDYVTEVYSCKT
jgi:SAM-dependent methyltransferase